MNDEHEQPNENDRSAIYAICLGLIALFLWLMWQLDLWDEIRFISDSWNYR